MRALLLAAVFAASSASALEVPNLNRRVTDLAGVLSSSDTQRIESKLVQNERATGHQFAVLIVPTLGGDVLEQYSIKVAERWRLGDVKRSDGILVLVAMQEHRIRIEVGYGLEGAVPDAVASRIINDYMVPKMRSNDVAGAVDAGTDALMKAASGESLGPAPRSYGRRAGSGCTGNNIGIWIFVAILVIGRILPLLLRVPIYAVMGAFAGWALLSTLPAAGVCFVLGGLIAFIPSRRGGGYYGSSGWGWGSSSSSSSWSSSSSSGGGGFSGGGGSFGGGGASGGW